HLSLDQARRQPRRGVDRQDRLRVLLGPSIHREPARPEADDGTRQAGRSVVGCLRLHAGTQARAAPPPATGLPERLMRSAASPRWALIAMLPLLIAASDPPGDVAGCTGGAGSGAPDLVDARGEIVELGTSARWELTFAEPLTVPDAVGH